MELDQWTGDLLVMEEHMNDLQMWRSIVHGRLLQEIVEESVIQSTVTHGL